jgi:hypothetical protein
LLRIYGAEVAAAQEMIAAKAALAAAVGLLNILST